MAAELFALCAGLVSGFAKQQFLQEILGKKFPLSLYTDSMTACGTVTTLCNTAATRFLADIYGLRDAPRGLSHWRRAQYLRSRYSREPSRLHYQG